MGRTYFFVLTDRETEAFNETYPETDNVVLIDELWDGDKTSGSFNGANVHKLIQMLSNSANGTVEMIGDHIDSVTPNVQGISMITATDLREYDSAGNIANKSIVVTLGGFKWIVTCLSKDSSGNVVATLWLGDAPSTTNSYGNHSTYYGADSFTTGIPSGMYGASHIRAVTLNNGGEYANITKNSAPTGTLTAMSSISHDYGAFTHEAGALYQYIVAPNQMPYQTLSQGKTYNGRNCVLNNESLKTDISVSEFYNGNANYVFQGMSHIPHGEMTNSGYLVSLRLAILVLLVVFGRRPRLRDVIQWMLPGCARVASHLLGLCMSSTRPA